MLAASQAAGGKEEAGAQHRKGGALSSVLLKVLACVAVVWGAASIALHHDIGDVAHAFSPHCEAAVAQAVAESAAREGGNGLPQYPVIAGVNAVLSGKHELPAGHAVLLLTYNRPDALRRTLDSLLARRPAMGYPVFVSQDGNMPGMEAVVAGYYSRPVYHLRFQVDESQFSRWPNWNPAEAVYFRIAQHYGWALSVVFGLGYDKVVIVEDDMAFAPDFFEYFTATAPLLDEDDSLMCVSAWNDNGIAELTSDPSQLLRTDCFPGLGWMMPRRLWEELQPKWPGGYWDDWLRLPEQRRGRSCVFPEVNRVFTFGDDGSSRGQFFDTLKRIRLNDVPVAFTSLDLGFLHIRRYDRYLRRVLKDAVELDRFVAAAQLKQLPRGQGQHGTPPYVVQYSSLDEFNRLANAFGIMTDHKSGIPRSSYQGVLSFRAGQVQVPSPRGAVPSSHGAQPPHGRGYRVFLVPDARHMRFERWKRPKALPVSSQ